MSMMDKTGKELALTDDDKEPLLLKMSMQNSDYMQALSKFQHKTLVAATHFDYIVPFCSAAILPTNKYEKPAQYVVKNILHNKYSGKHGFKIKEHDGFHHSTHAKLFPQGTLRPFEKHSNDKHEFGKDDVAEVEYLHKMVHELHHVPWRRVVCEYTLEHELQKVFIHDCPIRKLPHLISFIANEIPSAKLAIEALANILVHDHEQVLLGKDEKDNSQGSNNKETEQ